MLKIELQANGPVECRKYDNAPGAEGWEGVEAKGGFYRLTISKGGETQISIGIGDDGSLTLTDYNGCCYEQLIPQNFTLRPHRPWPRN